MEKKLYVFVCQMVAHHGYPEFDQKLRELKAVPLMHSIWAARTPLTATELKYALRKTLDDSDRILVVEVSGGWASRRAENNLGKLLRQGAVRLSASGSNAGRVKPRIFGKPGCYFRPVCPYLIANHAVSGQAGSFDGNVQAG